MRNLRTARSTVTKFAEKPSGLYRGRLAEDYDGIGQYVLVALAGSSVAGAYKARVAAGDFGGGRVIPAGTPCTVHSYHGTMEVFLGNIPSASCNTELCQREQAGDWNNADGGFDWVKIGVSSAVVSGGVCSGSGFTGDSGLPNMSIPYGRMKEVFPFHFLFLGKLSTGPLQFVAWHNSAYGFQIQVTSSTFSMFGPSLVPVSVAVPVDITQDFYVSGEMNTEEFTATIWQATDSQPSPQLVVSVVDPEFFNQFLILWDQDLMMKSIVGICVNPA